MLTTERMIDLEREALGEVGMLGRERWSSTRSAASAKVGTPLARRFSERGSPPERASLRLAM